MINRNRQLTRIVGSGIGLMIVFTFVIGLLNIGSGNNNDNSVQGTPFGTPPPPTPLIIPTPDPDPQLEGSPPYIHSSGYFQVFQPAGNDWFVTENPGGELAAFANVVIQSTERLVVILNELQPGVEYETHESLSENELTAAHFAGIWLEYDNWEETARTVTEDNVIIDFALSLADHGYLGRTITWLDDGWMYDTRLVVPDNNPALLNQLSDLIIPAFVGYPDLQRLPQTWPSYLDRTSGFVFKYPPALRQIAGGVGRPVTFRDQDQTTTVRAWTEPDLALAAPEDAEAWVIANEPTAAIIETAETEREVGSGYSVGYSVAYTYRDTSGDEHSGLAVLLNDTAGTLFVADLQINPPGQNLLEDDDSLSDVERSARQAVADGFVILPDSARSAADTE